MGVHGTHDVQTRRQEHGCYPCKLFTFRCDVCNSTASCVSDKSACYRTHCKKCAKRSNCVIRKMRGMVRSCVGDLTKSFMPIHRTKFARTIVYTATAIVACQSRTTATAVAGKSCANMAEQVVPSEFFCMTYPTKILSPIAAHT